MNQQQQKKFREFVTRRRSQLFIDLKLGGGRPLAVKEENYREVQYYLEQCECKSQEKDVSEAVGILREVMGRERPLEIQKPPQATDVARKLAELNADSSDVRALIGTVQVRLDVDQLKHQPNSAPIGTRLKGGGNRFINTCDAAWHRANTMVHMAEWANRLGPMTEGQQQFHGQAVPVNGIHYEGYCLLAGGHRYVLFHCYPADNSRLRL